MPVLWMARREEKSSVELALCAACTANLASPHNNEGLPAEPFVKVTGISAPLL
jgi:hypothetical protein